MVTGDITINMALRIIMSKKGKPLLIINGFSFRFNLFIKIIQSNIGDTKFDIMQDIITNVNLGNLVVFKCNEQRHLHHLAIEANDIGQKNKA